MTNFTGDYSQYQKGLGDVASRVAIRVREQMFDAMMALAKPTAETRVLDVGVTSEDRPGTNFVEDLYPYPESLTATGAEDASYLERKRPGVRFVRADASALPFADGSFDLVIASAMIEHVGSRQQQRRVVQELCRVGGSVCLTTPNRFFPLEFHTVVPLLHWLPAAMFRGALRRIGRDFYASEETLNLLSEGDLLSLVPAGRRAVVRRFRLLGWTSNLLLYIEPTDGPPRAPRHAGARETG